MLIYNISSNFLTGVESETCDIIGFASHQLDRETQTDEPPKPAPPPPIPSVVENYSPFPASLPSASVTNQLAGRVASMHSILNPSSHHHHHHYHPPGVATSVVNPTSTPLMSGMKEKPAIKAPPVNVVTPLRQKAVMVDAACQTRANFDFSMNKRDKNNWEMKNKDMTATRDLASVVKDASAAAISSGVKPKEGPDILSQGKDAGKDGVSSTLSSSQLPIQSQPIQTVPRQAVKISLWRLLDSDTESEDEDANKKKKEEEGKEKTKEEAPLPKSLDFSNEPKETNSTEKLSAEEKELLDAAKGIGSEESETPKDNEDTNDKVVAEESEKSVSLSDENKEDGDQSEKFEKSHEESLSGDKDVNAESIKDVDNSVENVTTPSKTDSDKQPSNEDIIEPDTSVQGNTGADIMDISQEPVNKVTGEGMSEKPVSISNAEQDGKSDDINQVIEAVSLEKEKMDVDETPEDHVVKNNMESETIENAIDVDKDIESKTDEGKDMESETKENATDECKDIEHERKESETLEGKDIESETKESTANVGQDIESETKEATTEHVTVISQNSETDRTVVSSEETNKEQPDSTAIANSEETPLVISDGEDTATKSPTGQKPSDVEAFIARRMKLLENRNKTVDPSGKLENSVSFYMYHRLCIEAARNMGILLQILAMDGK